MSRARDSGDTIAAISTAPGRGAIGIVRVSGPRAAECARAVTGGLPAARHAHYGAFRDGHGAVIDRGLCVYFPRPASYTGEDLVEFQLHGSLPLLRELLETLYRLGARPAGPGEFTERAFLNGRIDLLQAEAVAAIIDSHSVQAARAAVNACGGEFSRQVDAIAHGLRALRMQIEAVIDFGDDVPTDETEAVCGERLAALEAQVAATLDDARRGARLARGLDVALVGRPNSGKSTLLNRLCGDERAIVTAIPGTTRDVLTVDVVIDGLDVRLHDTAGLRATDDPVEREGVERAWRRLAHCDLALHLRAPDVEDDTLADEIRNAVPPDVPVLSVLTKTDLRGADSGPVDAGTVAISARTGAGLGALRAAIVDRAGARGVLDAPFIARARHVHALERAAASVSIARAEQFAGGLELTAEQLAIALRELEELTGVYTTEDLLGDVFANFCIGK